MVELRIVFSRLKAGEARNECLQPSEEPNSRQWTIQPPGGDAVILDVRRIMMKPMIAVAEQNSG
jgi:hypothetical protein